MARALVRDRCIQHGNGYLAEDVVLTYGACATASPYLCIEQALGQ